MKKKENIILKILSLMIVMFISSCVRQETNLLKIEKLKCEYLENPIGIDAAFPRLAWQIKTEKQGVYQKAYQIVVGIDSAEVASGSGKIWESGIVNSSTIPVIYQGQKLQAFTRYFWDVQVQDENGNWSGLSPVASFETGMMNQGNWKGDWISDTYDYNLKPAPYFRKAFDIQKSIKSARAYIAVAGLYELYLNGKKVGNHRLDPMYTRFDRRTLYVTYDVIKNLQKGENVVGVILGNGWFNHQSTAVWNFDKAPWRARPRFCLNLRITYEDGKEETIDSGTDWKTSLSPIIFNSIYTAEHQDDRLLQPGWNTGDFDDSKWVNAIQVEAPSKNIVAQVMRPIRYEAEIKPASVKKVSDRKYIYDLGRNISGVTRISVKGEKGTVVRVKQGELLDKEGNVDLSNIDVHYRPTDDSDPFQTDIYILNGEGVETFVPHFNYKGFQYVEVTSDHPIEIKKLTGIFMHSDVPAIGKINSSSTTLNKIWWATNNSYLSNLQGYPTDCPQREKNGWTGDAHIASETGLYNFDVITIYEKWMADHRDEQQPDGVLPAIIPTGGWGYTWANGPDWTSTIAIIPWNVYLFYGDPKLLHDCYNNIKRYVDHITSISPDGTTDWGLGDWVPVKSVTPKELTSSLYYFVDAKILANAAKLFKNDADYKTYSELAAKTAKAINAKYLNTETGIYGSGFQTELSAPLFWGIVPENMKAKVAANLAKRVIADNKHLDVGLLGTKTLLNALSENGYADLAYEVAAQEDFPSWGNWVVHGATTLYENWPLDASLDISKNHIMFGEISAWYYKALGGMKPDPSQPGFKNILLEPHFVKGLDSFSASHDGPYGEIKSSWHRVGNMVLYNVVVPANSKATLTLLGKKINLNGKVIYSDANGKKEPLVKDLQAGNYTFKIEK